MAELPSGTVTFLFSDVEGSTHLLERHGTAMGRALARHHELFEQIVERHNGAVFETVGDAVYAAFGEAGNAAAAALDAQRALAAEDWGPIGRLAVRIALHTGSVERRGDHYFGPALFRVARLQALAYGEQTLCSGVTARLAADALPEGASLRDLGTHRLKDLGEPEHVHQLVHPDLPAEFPALRSLDAHPHNLPVQLSSFVGRDAEVTELGQLLGHHRLVTLLGPGGIGKTRLALQVAAEQLGRFADGVWFVDLAPLRDPELVAGAIATILGLREQPGQPVSATLGAHLTSRELLLVLDNLEHLLPGATARVAEVLSAAPRLRVLATSRAPLRISGEQEYAVPTLSSGSADRLEAVPPPAVALFVERACAIRPLEITVETGPVIARICNRLDGLPLAIELAAARTRTFSLRQLEHRLDQRLSLLGGGARDRPERQQTLRATISWSTELLSAPERRLFSRLGLFVGGFTLEAAEAVAGPGLDLDVLDGLTALLEKSLMRQMEGRADDLRYTMLETIREAALAGLQGSGDSGSVVDRYVDFYVALVEAAEPHLRGSPQQWLDRLEQEHDNLRAVLTHLQASNDALRALRFVGAVHRLWQFRGYLAEGLQRMEAVLALDAAPSAARGKALNGFAALAIRAGASELAEKPLEEALALHQRLGDVFGIAWSTFLKGLVLGHHGDFQGARRLFEETAAAFTKLGDDHYALLSLRSLGWAWDEIGEAARAQAVYDQALERARQLGNRRIEAMALDGLSRVAVRQSRFPDAVALVGEAAAMWQLLGELPALSSTLCVAARALAAVGRSEDSVRVLARAMMLQKEIGASQNPWLSTVNAETTAATRTHLGEDTWSQVFADGNTLGVDEVVALARRGVA